MTWFLRGVLIATLAGCGYTSQYTPPDDGRARPLWSEDHLVTNLGQLPGPCLEAIDWQLHPGVRAPLVPRADRYWGPVYYGPDIVVVTPGLAPILPHPVLFSPSLTIATAAVRASSGGGGGGGLVGGGGGGGGGGKEVLLILAIIAVIVLPALDLGLAASRPESGDDSAEAIDRVNAYNDLARFAGTPCSYGAQ